MSAAEDILPEPEVPSTIGDYTIVGELATGGMAELYLARRVGPEGFARSVVVKRILPHLAKSEDFVAMFLDEARIAAGIRHPNVCSVEELSREDGSLYMVMEYLAGETAQALMRELARRERRLDPSLAAYIVAEACAGLHAAHEMRDEAGQALDVVHRDVSPGNLFVTYDGTVKVLDFGIAKAADRVTRTEAGHFKGKFAYMAPEQLQEQPIDRRADIFALGVVLFELLTSRRLFKQSTPGATLRAVLENPIARPSAVRVGVPKPLDEACLKALSRPLGARYETAADMRRDLLRIPDDNHELPDERLRALMGELFAERAAQKAEMIRQVRAGEQVERLVTETSQEFGNDLPLLGSGFTEAGQLISGRRKWWLAALVIGAALVGIGVTAALLDEEEPAPQPARVVSTEVEIRLASDPPGATVTAPNGVRATTPSTVSLPRGAELIAFEFELDGYEPWTERLVPDANQRVRVRLSPIPVGAPEPPLEVATDAGPPVAAPSRRGGRRQRRARRRGGEAFPLWE